MVSKFVRTGSEECILFTFFIYYTG